MQTLTYVVLAFMFDEVIPIIALIAGVLQSSYSAFTLSG